MTTKDYKMVAKAIVGCEPMPGIEVISKHELVERLSNAFMMDNPDFDPGKFYVACYPAPETELK